MIDLLFASQSNLRLVLFAVGVWCVERINYY